MSVYDAKNPTQATTAEREAAVGKRATLTLTGTIVGARDSNGGGCVMFRIDARWGFDPGWQLGMDLECFEIEESS